MIQKSLLYSRNSTLKERLEGALYGVSDLIWVNEANTLDALLERFQEVVVFVDLSRPDALEAISVIAESSPLNVIVTLGDERSEPMIRAEGLGSAFLTEAVSCPVRRLTRSFVTAQKYLAELRMNQSLRRQLKESRLSVAQETVKPDTDISLLNGLRAFSKMRDLSSLLDRGLHLIRDHHAVGSLGVFLSDDSTGQFKYESGLCCPVDIADIVVPEDSPLIHWLRYHPCVIDSQTLKSLEMEGKGDVAARLGSAMRSLRADVLFPLFANDLLGWVTMGRSTFGNVIASQQVEAISRTIDQMASAVESNKLHACVRSQRKQFEAILNALNIGIFLFNQKKVILWCNEAAGGFFGMSQDELLGKDCKVLGPELAAKILIHNHRSTEPETFSWYPVDSKREYLVEIYSDSLAPGDGACGFMFLQNHIAKELPRGSEQIREIEEEESKSAPTVSHRLRDPLTIIRLEDSELEESDSECIFLFDVQKEKRFPLPESPVIGWRSTLSDGVFYEAEVSDVVVSSSPSNEDEKEVELLAIKTKIASLGGTVNCSHNKGSIFVSLRLPQY